MILFLGDSDRHSVACEWKVAIVDTKLAWTVQDLLPAAAGKIQCAKVVFSNTPIENRDFKTFDSFLGPCKHRNQCQRTTSNKEG